jgi:phage shock protein A
MAIQKQAYHAIFFLGLFLPKACNCFVVSRFDSGRTQQQLIDSPLRVRQAPYRSTCLRSDKFNRDIDEKSRQRASNEAGGSMAAGAILGGLVGGPFGMLFAGAIAGNIGTKNAYDRIKKEEMANRGITQEMLDAAEEVGYALEQSMIGMEATRDSLRSQQTLARRVEEDMNVYYDKAKAAMVDGREEDARSFLLQRSKNQDTLKETLKNCAEEKKRIDVMESNVSALQKRALEVEAILQRAVGAKARQDSSNLLPDTGFSLSREDPLLEKFKDLGID